LIATVCELQCKNVSVIWVSEFMRIIVRLGILTAAIALSGGEVFAASCVTPAMSDQAVTAFKANPEAVLKAGSDSSTLEMTIRDLAGTDATLAGTLAGLVERSTPAQQTSIAAGLAQAALACATIDEKAAQMIQEAVASVSDSQFQAAYAAIIGDVGTAAVAGAAAASSSGSTIKLNPTTGAAGNTPVTSGAPTRFTRTGVLNVTGPSLTTTTQTILTQVVSPTR
jgi:hypothetical protein